MNVSEQLLDFLTLEGVKHIFGVAGDALNPLVDAIRKQDKVQWVNVNHEGNGSYAAYAQGALSGDLAVCASTVGPGALHLVNGLYNAKKERTPVLVITGQIPTDQLGTDYHQEVNLTKIYDDICEYQALIRTPEEVSKLIARAIKISINKKCVCRIELPADVAQMTAINPHYVKAAPKSKAVLHPDISEVDSIVNAINSAEKIGILAGVGCREAKMEVLQLAKKIHAPITHSLKASDIFDHDTDNVVGLTGLIGNPSGHKGVTECDLLLLLGTDFPYSDFLPEKVKTIQIDIAIENIGARTPVEIGVQADIKAIINAILPKVKDKEDSAWLESLRTDFNGWKSKMRQKGSVERDMVPPHPMAYARAIDEIAADDAIFVIDTGTAAIWASNHMTFRSDRRIIGSFNHGSMAVGLPAAIGAQLQFPEREVWALMGDGAFNMCMHEFRTAVRLNLPIKLMIFNNQELGFVKIEMEEAGLAPNLEALAVDNIDFTAYAELCGGLGSNVEQPEHIIEAIRQAKDAQKPFIINGKSAPGELSLPPRITLEEVKNFGTSKVKELIAGLNGDKAQWDNIKNQVNAFFD